MDAAMGAGFAVGAAALTKGIVTAAGRSAAAGGDDAIREIVQSTANKAEATIGGAGHVAGSQKHKVFADQLKANPDFKGVTEQSYKAGKPVDYGTEGSIRVDAVVGNPGAPTKIYDLKTGSSKLSAARVAKIREHLPPGSRDIQIAEIRPFEPNP